MEGHPHRGAVLTGIAGLLVGLLVGLIIGWWVWPVEWTATSLKDLKPEYKDEYIAMVSAAYARDGDLERAVHRLESLQAGNPAQLVVALAERYIAEGRDLDDIQCLAGLAEGLGVRSPQVLAYLATPTPTPTWTSTPTATPVPTATPTWTPTATQGAHQSPLPTPTPLPWTPTPTPPWVTATPTLGANAPTFTPTPTRTPYVYATPTRTPSPPPATPYWDYVVVSDRMSLEWQGIDTCAKVYGTVR
ncbi:MAG: hypothetical protein ACP5UM_13725, partial [Anaerolineae bacterium]